jgi:hypothetical protein
MIKSIIKGLREKDVQAVVNTYNTTDLYYPSLFPLRFTPTLTFKSIIADIGAKIMADVVSFDSRAPRKSRQVVKGAQGDIPKISVGRDKNETEINEYNQLLFYANTVEGATAILDWTYNDVEFCFNAVNYRLEWLALRAASTGKFTLTSQNNAGVVTEAAVDFSVPAANKSGVPVSITIDNAATSKPITKIKGVVKAAKAANNAVRFMWMDQDTFDAILASEETIKQVAPWVLQATQLETQASPASLKSFLSANNLPEVIIIDSQLTFEDKDNNRTVVQPWEPGVILFSQTKQLGVTWWTRLADESVDSTVAIKVKRNHILMKKFAVEEPLQESTIAMTNAIPALSNAAGLYLVDTLNTNWTK